jgi:hypothetical protein
MYMSYIIKVGTKFDVNECKDRYVCFVSNRKKVDIGRSYVLAKEDERYILYLPEQELKTKFITIFLYKQTVCDMVFFDIKTTGESVHKSIEALIFKDSNT